MKLRSVREADVVGNTVVLRTSLNVPVGEDGAPLDPFRLKKALPTIEYLSERNAKTIILGHLGRDGVSLQGVAHSLQGLTSVPIRFFTGALSEAATEASKMAPGECMILENIRREAGEEENSPVLSQQLAALGKLYVNDAFADSHRTHASIVGIAGLLPSYAGLLMEEEVSHLSKALQPPPSARAYVGGAKFKTKEPLIMKLLDLYERVHVVGAIADDFLVARGHGVGRSLVSEIPIPRALASDSRIVVEEDVTVVKDGVARVCGIDDIAADEIIMDAGPATAKRWSEEIAESPFVLWNGTLGVYEKGFIGPTEALGRAIVSAKVPAVIGGGDTLAALSGISFEGSRAFLSTGGGAMLQFLANGTLPGIEPLRA
ncbi:MAG: phosphoglycerate kinase [Patescibacteria group bacterium]|nr:phosphoglycerate kinase [Patescibacteria group bacterium]